MHAPGVKRVRSQGQIGNSGAGGLTHYFDLVTLDDVAGVVDSLAVVLATVLFGRPGDTVGCRVVVGGGDVQRLFTADKVPLKGDRW